MAADAAISGGVVVSTLVIVATGWTWVDPLTGLLVSIVIAWSALGLLKSAVHLSLDGVPWSVDRTAIEEWLMTRPGLSAVHDLHIWAMSTTSTALTVHLVMPGGHPGDGYLDTITRELERDFGIGHATFQIELGDGDACRLEPDDIA